MDWSYVVTRLHGNGRETVLENDLPLLGVEVTDDLSGPGGITGDLSPEIPRVDRDKLFLPWQTGVYVQDPSRHLRGGAILADLSETGPTMSIDCVGHSGYLTGQYFPGVKNYVATDAMQIHYELWRYAQHFDGGDIGVELDEWERSGVRLGTAPRDVNFQTSKGEDVSFEAGPYTLAYWETDDMGKVQDDLASETPFEYRMEHSWDGEQIRHYMRRNAPRIGRKLKRRFVLGENVFTVPEIVYGEYVTEVTVLGAGDGRKAIRSAPVQHPGGVRRAIVIQDKNIKSKQQANRRARLEMNARRGDPDAETLVIANHKHAPIGSYLVGDEIYVDLPGKYSGWGRIISTSLVPETEETTVKLRRVERV